MAKAIGSKHVAKRAVNDWLDQEHPSIIGKAGRPQRDSAAITRRLAVRFGVGLRTAQRWVGLWRARQRALAAAASPMAMALMSSYAKKITPISDTKLRQLGERGFVVTPTPNRGKRLGIKEEARQEATRVIASCYDVADLEWGIAALKDRLGQVGRHQADHKIAPRSLHLELKSMIEEYLAVEAPEGDLRRALADSLRCLERATR